MYAAGATFCLGNTFCTVIGYPACVSGASMRPTLNDGVATASSDVSLLAWLRMGVNWVFVNCWEGRRGRVERGDVVVFVSPKDPYDFVIKRLVGVEGDVVVGSDFSRHRPVVLDRGSCWVEGDNRKNSVDSFSNYGPIPAGLIFGKATHVIWPPSRWRRLDKASPVSSSSSADRTVEDIGGGHIKIVNSTKW